MRTWLGVLIPSPIVGRPFTILLALCAWVLVNISGIAIANTIPITPFGLNTQVNPSTTPPAGTVQYDITGGTRPGGGNNLFHSFGDFSVPSNTIANFLNDSGLATSNILGRVTEGNISNIYGTIQTTGFDEANLFLMNPAGFLFGPNATVNVGGMVTFTSADYLKLADNARFNAITNAADDALLSAFPVAAFGFLGSNPEAIRIEGSTFTLTPGTGLSIVGGDISIGADPSTGTPTNISAPSGTIDLVSVASPGEILYPSLQTGPNINGQTFTAKGTVTISNLSFLDVSGITGVGNEAGGAVRIRGGHFVMDNLSAIQNITRGNIAGENPGITIVVEHDMRISNLSSISVGTGAGLGRSGNLDVSAENIELLSGSFLTSTSGGSAAPGHLTITPTNSLTVSGLDPFLGIEASRISTSAQSSVEGGNITIVFPGSSLSVQDNATISTSSDTGRAGNITLNPDVLNVTNGGAIETTSANGSSGTIMITASDSAVISGQSALGNFSTIATNSQTTPANIFITAGQFGLADHAEINGDTASQQGGTVSIATTQSISISGNSAIRSSTTDGTSASLELSTPTIAIDQSTLSTRISGSNPDNVGGTIKVTATNGNISVSNNSLIGASTTGAADGGSIQLRATDSVIVTANSRIESTSTASGDAGNISINAGQQFDMRDSSVKTDASRASGGDIDIQAVDRVRLVNSSINTSVFGGDGNGGDITIDPNVVVLQGSQVIAQAFQGVGGDITITTPLFLRDSTSLVDASTPFGLNGTVTIQSPTSNVSGSLGPLTSKPSQAQALLTQRCAALVNGQASSFVVAGREQLPSDPGGWLSSPLAFAALGESLDADHAIAAAPAGMTMATQDTGTVSLRRLTPAGFLMANFADSTATGCHS